MSDLSPIHSDGALQDSSLKVFRRRRLRCELYVSSVKSRRGGAVPSTELCVGNVACAITSIQGESEKVDNGDVQSILNYEITLYQRLQISANTRIYVPARYPSWKKETPYAKKQLVVKSEWVSGATGIFECVRAGISGANEPRWPRKNRATVADGTAVWRLVDMATVYEVTSLNSNESNRVETIVIAKELN